MPENLLKVMVLGPPDKDTTKVRTKITETEINSDLLKAASITNSNAKTEALKAFYEQSDDLIKVVEEYPDGRKYLEIREEILKDKIEPNDYESIIIRKIGQSPEVLVGNEEWNNNKRKLNNSLITNHLSTFNEGNDLRDLLNLRQTLEFVEATARLDTVTQQDLKSILNSSVQLPSSLSYYGRYYEETIRNDRIANIKDAAQVIVERAHASATQLFESSKYLNLLTNSISELSALNCHDFVIEHDPKPDDKDCWKKEMCGNEEQISESVKLFNSLNERMSSISDSKTVKLTKYYLSKPALNHISDNTRALLKDLEVEERDLDTIVTAFQDAHKNISTRIEKLVPSKPHPQSAVIGGVVITNSVSLPSTYDPGEGLTIMPDDVDISVAPMWGALIENAYYDYKNEYPHRMPLWAKGQNPSMLKPAGKGRLYVIKQQILEYRNGEISHIENVLAGEKRERTHTRSVRLEEFTSFEEETETEEERNLTTTERSELESESSKVIKEKFDAKAGLNVSASYGVVDIEASGEVAYSAASEKSARTAQKIAREVTEEATKRIKERTYSKRERRMIQETEERNLHSFEADNSNNRIGVYQWLDKVYRAEVYDYGERTMYDILVPEPAAGLFSLAVKQKTEDKSAITMPEKISEEVGIFDVKIVNKYIKNYNVTQEIPPFPKRMYVTQSMHKSSIEDNTNLNFYTEEKSLIIPELYSVTNGWLTLRSGHEHLGVSVVTVSVGTWSKHYRTENLYGNLPTDKKSDIELSAQGNLHLPDRPEPIEIKEDIKIIAMADNNSLPFTVAADNFNAFTVIVTMVVEPTEEAITKWQQLAFNILTQTYQLRLQEWRDYENVAQFDGTDKYGYLLGRNPSLNRQIEKLELQRAVIEIILNRPIGWEMISESSTEDLSFPDIDLDSLKLNEKEIRLLQQGFEWQNITYVLYPYFYGRKNQWSVKALLQNPDQRFIEFLKSGAARVQVPVRKGYENRIEELMMKGTITSSKDDPLIGDDELLSIYDEEKESLGGNAPEAHISSEDFEIVVPTSLVKLREDSDPLPKWEKLEGKWQEVE